MEGDTIQAQLNDGAGDLDNITDDADDLKKLVTVNKDNVEFIGEASAKDVAARINAKQSRLQAFLRSQLRTRTCILRLMPLQLSLWKLTAYRRKSSIFERAVALVT